MENNLQYIDIEIDKLTNSLENVITADSFPTAIVLANSNDFKSVRKKERWLFNWKSEFKKPDTLGAIHVGGLLMVINTNAALKLIDKYFDK